MIKLHDMNVGDSNISYFIHYFDDKTGMWCPYINDGGYSYFNQEYLIHELNEAKKLSKDVKVFRTTTTRTM